jgi:suppressor of ftsI
VKPRRAARATRRRTDRGLTYRAARSRRLDYFGLIGPRRIPRRAPRRIALLAAGLLASASLVVLHQVIPHRWLHSAFSGADARAGNGAHEHGSATGGAPSSAAFARTAAGKRTSNCPKNPPPFIHDSFPEPEVRHSKNGLLDTRLRAATGPTQINGQTQGTSVYEGSFPGPTLVFCPGDTVRVRLENALDPGSFTGHMAGFTNLHTHGLHVSPKSPQDNIFLEVAPGSSYQYQYDVPRDEPPGAYWYHSHLHGQTSPQTRAGMAGAIIVEGGLDATRAYRSIGQRSLVIQKVPLTPGDDGPPVFSVNGYINPTIPIRPGEIQRWSIFNATTGFFVHLKLGSQRFQLLARDGNYLSRRTAKQSLVIPSGSRREVLVKGGPAGSTELIAVPFGQFPDDMPPQETLATLVSNGSAVNEQLPPKRIERLTDLRDFKVARKHEIVYTQDNTQDPPKFFINGRQFDPDRVDQVMHLNDVEQWTVRNKSNAWHTFHLHINYVQLTKIDGKPLKGVYNADNVETAPFSTVTLLTRPTQYTGKFVFHCHILGHEDLGMMATVVVKR